MEYHRFGDTILLRLDRGEELGEQLRALALREHIRLATVGGLGAVNEFTAGVYDMEHKRFCPNTFRGTYEIVALHGTVDTMGGETYTHLHMAAAGPDGAVVGGHLTRAVISATAELTVTLLHGQIDRRYDEDTGLNVFDFSRS